MWLCSMNMSEIWYQGMLVISSCCHPTQFQKNYNYMTQKLYMCNHLNRQTIDSWKTASQRLVFPGPKKASSFRLTRLPLKVQEMWRKAERLPQRSLILQLVVGHRLLLYWLPRQCPDMFKWDQMGLSEFFGGRSAAKNGNIKMGEYQVCVTNCSWISREFHYIPTKSLFNPTKPRYDSSILETPAMIPVAWKRCDCPSQRVSFGHWFPTPKEA